MFYQDRLTDKIISALIDSSNFNVVGYIQIEAYDNLTDKNKGKRYGSLSHTNSNYFWAKSTYKGKLYDVRDNDTLINPNSNYGSLVNVSDKQYVRLTTPINNWITSQDVYIYIGIKNDATFE